MFHHPVCLNYLKNRKDFKALSYPGCSSFLLLLVSVLLHTEWGADRNVTVRVSVGKPKGSAASLDFRCIGFLVVGE